MYFCVLYINFIKLFVMINKQNKVKKIFIIRKNNFKCCLKHIPNDLIYYYSKGLYITFFRYSINL